MRKNLETLLAGLLMVLGLALSPVAHADADHKMVIQVNTEDAVSQKMALISAGNLKGQLGDDEVDVEVVAYGPGIHMLSPNSAFAKRVSKLQNSGVVFSVCEGTLKSIKRKTGAEPQLVNGVRRVRTGALRIMELQEKGYAYMRP